MNAFAIYEKHPTADAYRVGGAFTPYAIVATKKRFSDAELAAEYHANEVEAWRMTSRRPEFYNVDVADRLERQETTLRRFATLPHFDA